jgi:LacI family transcriptional regulator, repressor for deo operon, udp, cdd, tsx, nupC, and nupG
MATKPTISDVAARAGVSKGAASFALNGKAGVSAKTRDRVLQVADELGFTPSATARALAGKRSDTLGLILARDPGMLGSDPFFPPFIAGVETALAPESRALTLRFVEAAEETAAYTDAARSHRMDGVILADLRVDDQRPALLADLALPYVSLNRPAVPSIGPAVCLDDRPGIRAAAEHLIELGHVDIAHVAGPADYLHANNRRAEWAATLREAGLPLGRVVESDFTAKGGATATEALLTGHPRPTAILYANDLMAIAGIATAQRHGIHVPDDLSIVGYDDIELGAHLNPPLSSVRTDAYAWGHAAAEALMALLAGGRPSDSYLPAATFVVRASTAPPRGTS